jgi:hypothetical protein
MPALYKLPPRADSRCKTSAGRRLLALSRQNDHAALPKINIASLVSTLPTGTSFANSRKNTCLFRRMTEIYVCKS